MNPLRWFRWKIIAALAIVAGGFYLLGLDPLAHRRINDLGSEGRRTRFNISALNLGVLRGLLDFDQLRVASARSSKSSALSQPAAAPEEKVFSAEKIQFQIDPEQALRKRLHGNVIVRMPRLQVERAADGSIRIGETGEEDGAARPDRPPTDWVKAAVEWAKRIKEWEEKTRKYRQRGEPKPGEAPEEKPEPAAEADYSRRVTYPFDDVARYVAKELAGEQLEIHFVNAGGAPKELAALTNGTLKIENLSNNPTSYSKPIRWTLAGDFAGGKLELSGDLDFTKAAAGRSALNLKLRAVGLPLELVNHFAGDTLPLRFTGGRVDVDTTVGVSGFDGLLVSPRLSLIEAKSEPQPGVSRIAGADAAAFCRTFNEVGTFDLNDLRIEGSFSDPKIHLGTTLQEMVTSGAKAFVAKHGRKALDQATDRAKQELDKVLEKRGGGLQQGVDGLKDAVGTGLKGIFSGEKKPDPKPEDPMSE